ncbi:MAG: hypothetical protein ACK5LZ_05185 [Anaerorhabdus sp.]
MKKGLITTIAMTAAAAAAAVLIREESANRKNNERRKALKMRTEEEGKELVKAIQEIENVPFEKKRVEQKQVVDAKQPLIQEEIESAELEHNFNRFVQRVKESKAAQPQMVNPIPVAQPQPQMATPIPVMQAQPQFINTIANNKSMEDSLVEVPLGMTTEFERILPNDKPDVESKEKVKNYFLEEDELEEIDLSMLDDLIFEDRNNSAKLSAKEMSTLEDKVFDYHEEEKIADNSMDQTIKEIAALYPHLNSVFIGKVLELLPQYNSEFKPGEPARILHRIQFDDPKSLMRFIEVVRSVGYEILGTDEDGQILIQLDFSNQDSKIVSEIYNVANQAASLNGIYKGNELEKL